MNAMAKMANPQRVEENVIDITKGVPCKIAMNKIWQKVESYKNLQWVSRIFKLDSKGDPLESGD